MAVLAVLATSFALASPAHAASADRFGEVPAVQAPDVAGVAEERTATLFADKRSFEPLPFARLDLAIMVLGSVILTMAAVGIPLLFSPLRLIAPARVRLRRASGRLGSSANKGGPAHVPA